jgi:hypothetical protein
MGTTLRTCGHMGWLVLVGACGGVAFTQGSPVDGGLGDGGSPPKMDGGASDVGVSVDAGSADGAVGTPGVSCGGTTCLAPTPVCCAGSPLGCAHLECGCETQLECAKDSECSGATRCCIDIRQDAACGAGHFVARCAIACLNGGKQLCNPGSRCLNGPCSTDSGDLSNVGLPAGAGFGVCK